MDLRDSVDRISDRQPSELAAAAVETSPGSTAALVSVICGIAACALNLFLITAPLGLLSGIIALAGGIIALRKGGAGRVGLILTFVSLFILLIYAASTLVPMLADPTARLMRG